MNIYTYYFFAIVNEERMGFAIVLLEYLGGHWGIGLVITSARLHGAGSAR